jgi:hypothetical protein
MTSTASKASRVAVVAAVAASLLIGTGEQAWAAPALSVDPTSGPAGTAITVTGTGFTLNGACDYVSVSFVGANGASTTLGVVSLDSGGGFRITRSVPAGAATGTASIQGQRYVYASIYHRCIQSWIGASTHFTVTTAPGTQLLGNPGFENGKANPVPWVVNGARINNSWVEVPHTLWWDAWLSGTGTSHSDSIYQEVTVPGDIASLTLTFWLHIDTADTSTVAHDLCKLTIRDTSNTVLAPSATYTNLNAAPGYTQQSFDLTPFKGQTIRVFLWSKENASLQTSFVVDDFALTTG